jgi:hypothetical protein
MITCAFLTITDMSEFVSDDALGAERLRQRGWAVEFVPWDTAQDWSRFDLVVIRSTWDYFERPQPFLAALAAIERSASTLLNSLNLVRWNLNKRYLADLDAAGAPVVPTRFAARLEAAEDLAGHFAAFDREAVILKPLISANAFDTFLVPRAQVDSFVPRLLPVFGDRPYMAQPFMPHVLSEGEYSLIYFNGALSHAILKTPAPGDFRVQEEHGGQITAVSPSASLRSAGQRALESLDETPLYARVDLVRDAHEDFLIMEFELIEPSLYLRMDPAAPDRFADALAAVTS